MTPIDLTQSPFLMQLLESITTAISKLNPQDLSLSKSVQKFNAILENPKQVIGEDVRTLLQTTKDVVSSYGITPKDKPSPGDHIAELPIAFYNAEIELDHLIQSKRLLADDRLSHLALNAKRFYLLAVG